MKLTASEIKNIIAEKIPEGLVVAEHDKYGHFYRHTGVNERYASVTTRANILDMPHLKSWAANQAVKLIDRNLHTIKDPGTKRSKVEEIYKAAVLAHDTILQDAGGIGTSIHNWLDKYLQAEMARAQDN